MYEPLIPETLTIGEFMANAIPKKIPRFQRSYAWEQEQVKDLLNDIDAAMSRKSSSRKSPSYFLGAMLCIEHKESKAGKKNHYHEIVDGQQRLVTLSIIFDTIQHWVNENDTPQTKKQLGMPPSVFANNLADFLYCGRKMFENPDKDHSYLLTLGEADHIEYRQIIKDGLSNAGGKRKRFNDAYKTIFEFFKNKTKQSSAKYLKDFAEFLAKSVYIVAIYISDEADAYEVFEVLNARNMELTAVDLIKNKLLSCFGRDEEAVKIAHEQWNTTFIVCSEHPARMQDYVRCHFQIQAGNKVDPKKLYRHLRDMLGNEKQKRQRAVKFLGDLEKHCHEFGAMFSKDNGFWEEFKKGKKGKKSDINSSVGYLKEYRVVYTIMFAMLYAKKPKDFIVKAYRLLTVFIKRTRAVGDRFSVIEYYEEEFARLSHQFKNNKGPKNINEFLKEIKRIDVGGSGRQVLLDQNFIEKMSERTKIGENDAKLILVELSNYLQDKEKTATHVDAGNVTLEHIFPKKPNDKEWPEFQDKDIGPFYLGRLGNLALLQGQRNTEISNKKFSYKKQRGYAPGKCGILLTNELYEIRKWTPDEVKKRSVRLATLAAKVWSFKID